MSEKLSLCVRTTDVRNVIESYDDGYQDREFSSTESTSTIEIKEFTTWKEAIDWYQEQVERDGDSWDESGGVRTEVIVVWDTETKRTIGKSILEHPESD